jgi:hypothetical protein
LELERVVADCMRGRDCWKDFVCFVAVIGKELQDLERGEETVKDVDEVEEASELESVLSFNTMGIFDCNSNR